MKLATIKWGKSDDGKKDIFLVKPSLYTRITGKAIPIFGLNKKEQEKLNKVRKELTDIINRRKNVRRNKTKSL